MTESELEELRRRWIASCGGQPVLLTPLPRKIRLRLALHHVTTDIGIWLGDHVSWSATERFWRITGLI